ncbi:MAG: hypothetical protein ACJ70Z_00190 [Nitrososphaera sp.]
MDSLDRSNCQQYIATMRVTDIAISNPDDEDSTLRPTSTELSTYEAERARTTMKKYRLKLVPFMNWQ